MPVNCGLLTSGIGVFSLISLACSHGHRWFGSFTNFDFSVVKTDGAVHLQDKNLGLQ